MAATDGERDPRRRRAAGRSRRSARAGPSATGSAARDMERWTYQRPFELVECPAASRTATCPTPTSSCSRTTSPPRTAPAWCTSPPPSARTTSRSCRRYGLPSSTRSTATGHFARRRPPRRRAVLQARRRRPGRRPRPRAGCCSGTCPTSTATRTAGAATPRSCTTPSRRGTSAPPRSRTRCSARTRRPTGSPTTIKHGRYGDWLDNNIDWALSRSRYWGTPLPIWRCAEDHQICVGSLAELSELDRHRPVRARPAPAVRRRRHLRLPDLRRDGATGCPR